MDTHFSGSQTRRHDKPLPVPAGRVSEKPCRPLCAQDITERKKNQGVIAESEGQFRSFIRQSPDGIIILDEQGRILEWNDGEEQITGISRSEALNQPLWEVQYRLAPDEKKNAAYLHIAQEKILKGLKESLDLKRVVEDEIQRPDGTKRIIQSVIFAIPDGEKHLACGISRDITERKRTEEVLRESEERFRAAFENGALAMAVTSLHNNLIKVNKTFCQMLGYSESEMVGHSFVEFTHPDDLDKNLAGIGQVVRGAQNTFRMEKRYLHKDGMVIWGDMSTALVRDPQGHPLYIVTHIQDITQRRQAEDALRISEEKYRTLFENSPDGIFITVPDGKIVEANPAACAMLGMSVEEICQAGRAGIVEPGPEVDAFLEQRAQTGKARGEIIHIRKDGTRFPAEVTSVILDHPSSLIRSFIFVRDITERKRDEEALRTKEERMRQAARVAKIGFFDHNHRTDIIDGSPEYRSIRDLDPVQPITFSAIFETAHPEDRERVIQAVRRAHDPAGDGIYCIEHRVRHRDGSVHWVSLRSQTFFEGQGLSRRPIRTVGAIADITERKQMDESMKLWNESLKEEVSRQTLQLRALTMELMQVEQRERRRLANVLHDHLQQFLVLARWKISEAETRTQTGNVGQTLAEAREQIAEAVKICRSLTVDLCPPILNKPHFSDALDWLAQSMRERSGLEVHVHCEPDADVPKGDLRLTLFLAVRELLWNVSKHAGTNQARVWLTAQFHGDIKVVVADEGVGIDLSLLQTKIASGQHFGLSSLRERILYLGGQMQIDSTPGRGMTTTLIIPIKAQ